MKKNRIFLAIAIVLLFVSVIFPLSAYADEIIPTQQKAIITHNTENGTVELAFYISSETAIVGYSSFDYDSSVLTLLDKNGSAVANPIPRYSSDGSSASYLTDVVSAFNHITITDVSKGANTLINTDEGYIFFAWMLPGSYPFIDATKEDVLIAKINFKVKDGVAQNKVTENCITVAKKALTDNVKGWYPGLIVMNKNQKRTSYNGEEKNDALFVSEFVVDGKTEEKPEEKEPEETVPSEKEETPKEEIPNEEKVPTEEPPVQVETPTEEEKPTENDDATEEPTEKEEPSDDITPEESEGPEDDSKPIVVVKPDTTITDELWCAPTVDFNLSFTSTRDSIRVKWEVPEEIGTVDNYTIVILDSEYYTVREISGISGFSTSYTAIGLASGEDYRVYMMAKTGDSFVTSSVKKVSTEKVSDPETIISNVYYDEGEGYLYGLSAEDVVFGHVPSKVPEIIAPEGKYFIGWSTDGETPVDIDSMKIYVPTLFTALYSEKAPEDSKKYINGYEDGTFIPKGSITRAEAATIISRLCDDYDKDAKYTHEFTDCEEGFWYENPVAFCQQKGYIKGYEDGTFKPNGNITRAEFATILVRVFGFSDVAGINVFNDIKEHWGKNSICVLYTKGVILPDENGSFRADQKLTREDAVMMINRCLGTIPDRQAILENAKKNGYKFSDVPQYSESFFDIMSAVMK